MTITPIKLLKKTPLPILQEIVDTNYQQYFVERKFRKKVHELNSLRRFKRDIDIFDAYAITCKNKKLKEIAKLFNLSTQHITARVKLMLSNWEYMINRKYGRKEAEKELQKLLEIIKK